MLKVVILCGGRGRRLGTFSSNLPKPLVPLMGKPILKHIIEFYISKGLHNFVLCTGFRAEVIDEFISTHKFDAEIEISNTGEDAGMLKRLYLARELIDKKAIVTYGDTFVNIDPYHVLEEHNKSEAALTITIADIRSPFGLVEHNKDKKVTSYREKPLFSYYIGHMILERELLNNLDMELISMPDGEGLVSLFQKLIKEKSLNTYKHNGFKVTFNTPHDREKAEEEFIKFFTQEED